MPGEIYKNKKIFNKSNLKIFLILISTLSSGFITFGFPKSLNINYIGSTDFLLAQAQIQSIVQAGPFNRTFNLGFPYGFTQWNNPEFGLIQSIFIYFFGNLTQVTNFGLFGIINLISIFLNVVCFYLLSKLLSNKLSVHILYILLGSITPYSVLTFGHPHVLSFFILPLTLYILIKILSGVITKKDYLIFSIMMLVPSVFWINILLFIFLTLYILYLILYVTKNTQRLLLSSVQKVVILIFIPFSINFLMYYFHNSINGQNGRTYWQSDNFGGKFTDFIVSSPFINHFFNFNLRLSEIVSSEINARMVGFTLSLSIIFALPLIFISSYLKKIDLKTQVLVTLLQITFFYFFIGGFGNFQAALFALFNSSSPVRAWSRLIIFIGILSISLLVILIENSKFKRRSNFLYLFFITLIFLDLAYLKINEKYQDNFKQQEVFDSVEFLQDNLKPCPILQLPVDTYFIPQSAQDFGLRYYWNGMIPYLLAPNYKWSAAIYTDSPGWSELLKFPTKVSQSDLSLISKKYCAILFDTNFSQYQIDRKASLSAKKLIWPGLLLDETINANYSDTRFKVILLND